MGEYRGRSVTSDMLIPVVDPRAGKPQSVRIGNAVGLDVASYYQSVYEEDYFNFLMLNHYYDASIVRVEDLDDDDDQEWI